MIFGDPPPGDQQEAHRLAPFISIDLQKTFGSTALENMINGRDFENLEVALRLFCHIRLSPPKSP